MKILQHYLEMEEFNNVGDFLIAIDIVLNLIQKQSKIIDAMKYRVVLTEKEHRMILKMLERRSNKRYEDCVVEYFKKECESDEART